MNYYYDIILNWNEETAYNFYEWNDTDYLELIKKIPIFKVKHKTLIDILTNNIKVNLEFLNLIKDKTLLSGKNVLNKISYATLFTDNKNVIALEFNKDGYTTNRSKLLLDDELNILEISYNLKEYNLEYELISNLKETKELRQIREAKHLISLEINNLYQNKNYAKLRYLYYEYKQEKLEDIDEIYLKFTTDINKNWSELFLKLYYIIKLSYHNV